MIHARVVTEKTRGGWDDIANVKLPYIELVHGDPETACGENVTRTCIYCGEISQDELMSFIMRLMEFASHVAGWHTFCMEDE